MAGGYRLYTLFVAPNTLQNGSPDGLALSIDGELVQFLSYERSVSARLEQPTAFTPDLVRAAKELLGRIWRPGFRYKKAGVTLLDLADELPEQANLFAPHDPRKRALMSAMDAVNGLYGTGTVGVAGAAAGMKSRTEQWQMAQTRRSPSYTTNWNGLAEARA